MKKKTKQNTGFNILKYKHTQIKIWTTIQTCYVLTLTDLLLFGQ